MEAVKLPEAPVSSTFSHVPSGVGAPALSLEGTCVLGIHREPSTECLRAQNRVSGSGVLQVLVVSLSLVLVRVTIRPSASAVSFFSNGLQHHLAQDSSRLSTGTRVSGGHLYTLFCSPVTGLRPRGHMLDTACIAVLVRVSELTESRTGTDSPMGAFFKTRPGRRGVDVRWHLDCRV